MVAGARRRRVVRLLDRVAEDDRGLAETEQIAVLESSGAGSAEFQALTRRGTSLGIVLAVDVIVIVFLMVTKPTL